jgi:glutaminyl-tRNA synthetase
VSDAPATSNFLRQIIEEDLRSGRITRVVTRFPPEPNGYLHIGHAKAICIGFGLAAEYGGRCHLRMDDTNPLKEDEEYVQAIQRDIRWLGFDWGEHFYHASDAFDQLFDWAKHLIREGKAYVDEQSEEQIRLNRGTVDSPGVPSPWRDRPVAESLDKLDRMAKGDLPDGAMVLRAKIDMGHPNMKMRDPLMYRIRNIPHDRTGDRWHVYPLYDWAHGQCDALEGITHSLCTLEFDVNRELYDWYLANLPVAHVPRQYEFARLKLPYTVMSKRLLVALVAEGHVAGWDDPRMPTLAGYRRRGYTPASIRTFVERVGVAKANSVVDPVQLENAIREDLNDKAPRVMAVLDPVRLVVETCDGEEELDASYWPHDVARTGSRRVPFARELFIERDDFAAVPERGFKRLAPGRAVRLRYGYVVTCTGHETDAEGRVTVIRCAHDPATRGGTTPEGVKIWSTIHWVAADRSVPIEVRLYDRLFRVPDPGAERDFRDDLNPDSLQVVTARAEASLSAAKPGEHYQFERTGYIVVDAPGVFVRTVSLKDGWKRPEERPAPAPPPARVAEPKVAVAARKLGEVGQRLVAEGLSEDEAGVLESDASLKAWFDAALAVHPNAKAVAAGW